MKIKWVRAAKGYVITIITIIVIVVAEFLCNISTLL